MKRKKMPPLDPSIFAEAAVPQPDPVQVATKSSRRRATNGSATPPSKLGTSTQASRVGKVQVQVWVSADVRHRLKSLALNSHTTVEQLLSGAIDELLRKAKF